MLYGVIESNILEYCLTNVLSSTPIRQYESFMLQQMQYTHTINNVQELLRLNLFESFTMPVLTYGFDGLLMSLTDLNKLNVCWNNVYRKIFGMHIWESAKCVQLYCERLDLICIVHKRNLDFFNGLFHTSNCVIRECFGLLRRICVMNMT